MKYFFVLILAVLSFGCVKNKSLPVSQPEMANTNTNSQPSSHEVKVKEVVQGSSYTYMLVAEGGKDSWIAVNKQPANVGDTYYFGDALLMTNFTSKELNRTFPEIYFINEISTIPQGNIAGNAATAHSGKVQSGQRDDIKLEKSANDLTIALLFKNRKEFSGKKVKITGVVVKVNNGIMDRNWVHIQDGTSDSGNFDLTITTQDEVQVNQNVTFEGEITLDKDFGAGYFYDVVMEQATLLSKAI
jgi:hypothetical protein